MASCDTPVILDISLREKPRRKNWISFSIITGWLAVGMISITFSDSNLHTTTAHSWMWSTQKRHTAFGAIGEISTPEKEGWPGLEKVITDHKPLPEGRQKSSKHCQGPYNDFYIYLRRLWGKTVELVGWFHTIGEPISTMVFPILERKHLYIQSGSWCHPQ